MQTSIVFSQRTWAGVGDIDDCWCLSAMQAVHACAPWLFLPTVPVFRQAAGDPDDGKRDGGSINEIVLGVETLYHGLAGKLRPLRGVTPSTLTAAVKEGHPVSVALMGDKLPARLRYGVGAIAHQCTIALRSNGDLAFANPMAPMGSRWDVITWADVLPAIRAYGNGTCYAIAFPRDVELAMQAPGVPALVAEAVAQAHATADPAQLETSRKAGYNEGLEDAGKAVAAVPRA